MIDGGSSSSKSIGENTIEPFLLSHAVPSLDKVFITHADSDHTSGLLYLAESGKISADELYLPFCAESHEKYDAIRRICPDIRYIGAGSISVKLGFINIRYVFTVFLSLHINTDVLYNCQNESEPFICVNIIYYTI